MTTILHIESSPRKLRSASAEVASSFISRYCENNPKTKVITLDIWNMQLPEFDQSAMEAKYAGLNGIPLTSEQEAAWTKLQHFASLMHEADIILLSVPLWNFSIPYKLKHFIDLVSQKDILFGFNPKHGFIGLLKNKTAVVAYARGLDFSAQSITPSERFDFQKPYIEAWLGFIGINNVHSIIVEKTIFGDGIDKEERLKAGNLAKQLADQF